MFVWGMASLPATADMIDRLRPERLKAVHEAIEALKTQRREVKLSSSDNDVRAVLHVHSAFSHDSRGTLDEIVAAAKEAGVRVIMFNEHPASGFDYFIDGHRGFKDDVLLIPGAETGGFLAYPRESIQDSKTLSPQAFSDLVRTTGGLVFLCHLEERMDWDIANINGTEIYNTHADVKDESRFLVSLRSPLAMFSLVSTVKQYPQEVFTRCSTIRATTSSATTNCASERRIRVLQATTRITTRATEPKSASVATCWWKMPWESRLPCSNLSSSRLSGCSRRAKKLVTSSLNSTSILTSAVFVM